MTDEDERIWKQILNVRNWKQRTGISIGKVN